MLPLPEIQVLWSGVLLLPDPIGDAASIGVAPFFLSALTITPLALFLYFSKTEGLRSVKRLWVFASLELIFYGTIVLAIANGFMFTLSPFLAGLAFVLPPILTLVVGVSFSLIAGRNRMVTE